MNKENWKKMFDAIWKDAGNIFIQFLLDAGLDINALNKYGSMMLSYAAECGNLEMTEFLVQKGANVNASDSNGSSPLHVAALYGNKDIVKFFLKIGIPVDSCDNNKCTPLHCVAEMGNIPVDARKSYREIVHFLVDNKTNLNGCTPLLIAANNRREDVFELLIELGANIECCDENQWTALHYSSRNGWSRIVRSLVERKCDIDGKNLEGETALTIAARYSQADVFELLIELGANTYSHYSTLLHHACAEDGFSKALEYLMRN